MNEQKKQKLLEQYDDAAFALLMDEYAEEEGARLMAEFEAAQAAGQVPEMPRELDEQCRRMIRRDRAKKWGIRAARSFRKVAVKAAVAVLVFIGLITTVVMSVDALRVPMLNFFVEYFDTFALISTEDNPEAFNTDLLSALEGFIPMDYVQTLHSVDTNLVCTMYENADGETICMEIWPSGASMNIDTEDAECTEIFLGDYKALLIEKHGYQIVWTDDVGITYVFYASNLSKKEVIEICASLVLFQ